MTLGMLCWLCGIDEQQEHSPYCADCEMLHDLELLQPMLTAPELEDEFGVIELPEADEC